MLVTFLHNKEATHNSTTFTITFSKSPKRQFQVTKSEIYQKKKKNVSIRSYMFKETMHNSIAFTITFSKSPERQCQATKSKIYQKKRKEC